MPRTATAVAQRHGGGVREAPQNCHSSVSYRATAFAARNVRLKVFRKGRSHHPGAGVGPPSRAIARPSSAEEGNQNVQSPGSA